MVGLEERPSGGEVAAGAISAAAEAGSSCANAEANYGLLTPTSDRLAGCYPLVTTTRKEEQRNCDLVHGHQLDPGAGRLCRAGVCEPVMVFRRTLVDVVGGDIRVRRQRCWRTRR